ARCRCAAQPHDRRQPSPDPPAALAIGRVAVCSRTGHHRPSPRFMNTLKKAPLFRRVLIGIAVVFAVVAVATSMVSAWQLNRTLNAEFQSKGTAIARSIAGSADLLLARDPAALPSTMDEFLDISGVAYVFLIDAQDNIVSHVAVPDAVRQSALERR